MVSSPQVQLQKDIDIVHQISHMPQNRNHLQRHLPVPKHHTVQLGKILFILLAVLVEVTVAQVVVVATVALEDMGTVEVVTIIVAEVAMGIAALAVDIVGLVVDTVEAEDMDTVALEVHIVAVVIVVVVGMVVITVVVVEIIQNVTTVIIIKILDTSRRENQVLTDMHLQTSNANMKKKLCMLQKLNISSTKNASPFSPPVAGRNTQ